MVYPRNQFQNMTFLKSQTSQYQKLYILNIFRAACSCVFHFFFSIYLLCISYYNLFKINEKEYFLNCFAVVLDDAGLRAWLFFNCNMREKKKGHIKLYFICSDWLQQPQITQEERREKMLLTSHPSGSCKWGKIEWFIININLLK